MSDGSRGDPFRFYAGQLPVLGKQAQDRLANSRVLVVGAGRVGTNAVMGLHAAGVGTIEVIDPQIMEPEQLGPCWFATGGDLGNPKAIFLAEFLSAHRRGTVRGVYAAVESVAAVPLFRAVDVVICCANTVSARLTVERRAIAASIPTIQAAAFDGRKRLGGLVHVHRPSAPTASCFGCLCDDEDQQKIRRGEGLLASVTAIIGHLAAHLAVMELAKSRKRTPLDQNLLTLDLDTARLDALCVDRRPGCKVCG